MADVSITGRSAQAGLATLPALHTSVLTWITVSAGMVLLLLAPAIWNGFPLIFPETGGYLERPFIGTLIMGRSALYGLFLYAGVPAAFWSNAILQAALTAWLIALTLRAHDLGDRPWLALGIVALLSIFTSLAWFAGQLMPDILFPCAVLALYLLAFHMEELAGWERGGLAAVIAVTIPCHMAAAGLCVGLLASLWLIAKLARKATVPRPALTLPAIAIAAGIALGPLSNVAITGKLAFTPGGESFLFGRLVEDGIVARYLKDRCPDETLRLCAYRATLPDEADAWLWGPSTFYKLGGWEGYAEEERAIIVDTLKRYPLLHVGTAVSATVRQLLSFQTEVSLTDNEPTIVSFHQLVPQLFAPFMDARQQSDHFQVAMLNMLHVPTATLGFLGLIAVLLARRRLRLSQHMTALCLTVLVALVVNAAICGVFSHPVDRYQSRLMPLAPFALAILLARRSRRAGELSTPAMARA